MSAGSRSTALVATVLVALLVGALATLVPTPAAAQDEAPVVPATPVLSARRLPAVLQGTVADPRLAEVVDPYLDGAPGETCAVVLDRGRVAYARNPDAAMVPASLLKLLNGVAALEVLGPDTRLPTVAGTTASFVDGVVEGDLFVVGGGDPLLTTPGYQRSLEDPDQMVHQFGELATALAGAGVREVRGDVVGDDSRYETVRWVPTWPTRYQREGFVGPLSALMVNDGVTGFTETPDEENPRRQPGDPPALAAQTLVALLEREGVRVTGTGAEGTAPDGLEELARIESPPVSDLVTEMILDSDNTTAELLAREMGLRAEGAGTTAAGTQVIAETLASLGYDTEGLALNDGSGLDPANRVPCGLVLDILQRNGPDSLIGRALAVAGTTGTLRDRMQGSEATGVVHAKTGTLNEVNALAGFADTPPGSSITFVLVQNGLQPNGLSWVDRYADLLMGFADGPPLDALGPLPPTS